MHRASKAAVRFALVSVRGIRSVSDTGFSSFLRHANVRFFQRYFLKRQPGSGGVAFPPRRRPAARPAARPHSRSPRAHGRSGRWLASAPSSEPPRAAFALPVFASPGGSPSAGSHEAAGLRSRFRGTGEDPTPRQHRAVLPTRAERLCLWSSSVPFVGAVWTPYVRIWLDLGLSISFSDGNVNGIVFLMSNSDCLLPEKNFFFSFRR